MRKKQSIILILGLFGLLVFLGTRPAQSFSQEAQPQIFLMGAWPTAIHVPLFDREPKVLSWSSFTRAWLV